MKKKFLFIIIPIVVIIIGISGAYYYVNYKIYKSTKIEDILTTKEQQQKSQYELEHGIFNVLLCGLDGRTKDSDSRTDSMILANIDTNKKTVKLVSFMRDMYVPIPGHSQNRINSAFFLGGPELLMKTLNEDFNLDIQYYGTIDFKAFQAMVDSVGGIDIDVKDYELKQLNYYIKEANWSNPIYLERAGFQHLNGQQALSYCRIRKVGNNDYERTERQRRVLSLLIKKTKGTSVFKFPQLVASLLPYIKTNIPTNKIASLGFTVLKFGGTSVDTARVPADTMFQGMKINGSDVLVPDMEKNVAYLDNFLSANGSIGVSNMPSYMANNFHMNDDPIDKRGIKRKTVQIIIPKNSTNSKALDPVPEKPNINDVIVPPVSDGTTVDPNPSVTPDTNTDPGTNTPADKTDTNTTTTDGAIGN